MNTFGNDYILLSDEDGNSYELEHLYNFEYSESEYAVFLPAGELAGQDNEMIILRVVYNKDCEEYESIPEDTYDDVYTAFMDTLYE